MKELKIVLSVDEPIVLKEVDEDEIKEVIDAIACRAVVFFRKRSLCIDFKYFVWMHISGAAEAYVKAAKSYMSKVAA